MPVGSKSNFPLTREFLYQAYCIERKGILEIARIAHCRNDRVASALHEFGLNEKTITKEWLLEHYVSNQESIDDIATLWGVTESAIRSHLRKHQIPIRYKSRGSIRVPELNNYDWLYEHYVTLQWSACKIADLLKCHDSGVLVALERNNIPRRNAGGTLPISKRHISPGRFSRRKRNLVKDRDGHQCRICANSQDLQVHHIIPRGMGGKNALDNGITLCYECHNRVRGDELALAPFYFNLIGVKQEPLT